MQCCQRLAELSGQCGGKIWLLMKNFGPLVIFTLLKTLGFRHKNSLYMSVAKVYNSWTYQEIREKKIHFLEVRPLFGPFFTKLAKIRPQICTAAPLLFGPFWVMRPNNRPVCHWDDYFFSLINRNVSRENAKKGIGICRRCPRFSWWLYPLLNCCVNRVHLVT